MWRLTAVQTDLDFEDPVVEVVCCDVVIDVAYILELDFEISAELRGVVAVDEGIDGDMVILTLDLLSLTMVWIGWGDEDVVRR